MLLSSWRADGQAPRKRASTSVGDASQHQARGRDSVTAMLLSSWRADGQAPRKRASTSGADESCSPQRRNSFSARLRNVFHRAGILHASSRHTRSAADVLDLRDEEALELLAAEEYKTLKAGDRKSWVEDEDLHKDLMKLMKL
jgi:hypothetical protein